MSSEYFPLPLQDLLSENIDPLDVDKAADIAGLLQAVRDGVPLPPKYKPPVAKSGRSDFSRANEPVTKRENDWDEPVAEPVAKTATVKTSESQLTQFQRNVVDRLRKMGVDEAEAVDLIVN